MTNSERYGEAADSPIFFPEGEVELIDRRSAALNALEAQQYRPPMRNRRRLTFLLFAATCVSTFLAGMLPGEGVFTLALAALADFPRVAQFVSEFGIGTMLWNGLTYSVPLIVILFAHEMGHYLQARRYRVPASLPYFIPFPISPFGTMGAVIVQGAGYSNRKVLFDIAVSGPLAGLVFALPITYWGLMHTEVISIVGARGNLYGDPLILIWMAEWIHGPMGTNETIALNAPLFAGWVGIFITALNLLPVGQLDGGHIMYALIGRKAHAVAFGIILLAIGYMIYTRYPAFLLLILLLIFFGPRHPPTANDRSPLGWHRILLGWLVLGFVIIGLTPQPIVQMM